MAPGSYDLVAIANGAGVRLAGSQPLDISNRDIEGITLTLQPQLSVSGKISIENLQTTGNALNLGGIRVELRHEPYTPELLVVLPTISPDGTFTFSAVTPGDYRLKVETRGFKG